MVMMRPPNNTVHFCSSQRIREQGPAARHVEDILQHTAGDRGLGDARQWLDKSVKWQSTSAAGLPWNFRRELRPLQKEAETLLKSGHPAE
jgi:hypothetical protein